jgi:hypothetical protein
MGEKNKTERYTDHINSHILPFIDYSELHKSYETDMAYAKGILNRLHTAMIDIYGGERLDEQDGDDGFAVGPGVIRAEKSGGMCLALFDLDLSSSGEHYGTSYLCKYGVVSQDMDALKAKGVPTFAAEIMNKAFIPYDYGYTATIPCDIHVTKSRLLEALRDVLNDFKNHNADLIFDENEDNPHGLEAYRPTAPEPSRGIPEKSAERSRFCNLAATYEELFNIPDDRRVTYYFGDAGSHYLKHGVSEDKAVEIYGKGLEAIGKLRFVKVVISKSLFSAF